MNVLTFGSERNLFVKDSEAQKRIKEYGELFNELHIIVFTKSDAKDANKMRMTRIADNVFIYPTNSRFKLLYLWGAYKLGKALIANSKAQQFNDSRYALSDWRITCQDPFESGLIGWFFKLRFNLPLQLQIHTDIFSPYFWQESWKNKLRVLLAKFLLPRADGIRVVSERIKNSLLTLYPKPSTLNPVSVLPIFVDVKKIQSAKVKIDLHQKYPEYDFIILMASRLTGEKNILMAIEAMRRLTQKGTQTNAEKILLLIVGDGPELKSYKLLVKSYKLENNVRFEFAVDSQTLFSYYKTADLFLLTSNYEGYGRTVVEAMAAGLPVIMTDVGLAGEPLIDDLDGKVIPIGDKKALVAAILELQENPAKREEFKQNSLKLLEKWPTKQEYLEKYKNSLSVLK